MIKIDIHGKISKRDKNKIIAIADKILGESTSDSLIEVKIVSEKNIAVLNKKYRSKSGATDVLSFPQSDIPGESNILGSIIICPKFPSEAFTGVPELFHHWLLHLLGYDHETNWSKWSKIYNETRSFI